MKISDILRVLLPGCLGLYALASAASPDIRVVGLFSDRAVVVIDGQRQVLRTGETGPHGVRLISADSEAALLEVDGQRFSASLDGRITKRKHAARKKEVQVYRNPRGLFTTVGSINGLPVPFLVDTGASTVAMNADMARRLGIDFRVEGEPAMVVTASGRVDAWRVTLDSVKVGDLELRGIDAVVIDGAEPATTLLGMSYLGQLEIENDSQFMTLRLKY
ncbi:MAG: TIGR02281 family clan AA aspartic protease [Thiohalobacterales bacterium]|nr:TIGR02281 family clan AA aspartic protease [Thiohalobacterales bacterium]